MSGQLRSKLLSHSKWRDARWLVIAPHADDETLGCGALIHEAALEGRLAGVAFLTDGSGSHACDSASAKTRLIARRKQEARSALRLLAPHLKDIMFLGWPDAHPYRSDSRAWAATVDHLVSFCRANAVDAIAVTGRDEPHCDHVAAYNIATAVAAAASRATITFEYIVWAKQPPGAEAAVIRTRAMPIARRHLALAQHRSQLTPFFGDGFRVPASMRRMPAADLLYTRGR